MKRTMEKEEMVEWNPLTTYLVEKLNRIVFHGIRIVVLRPIIEHEMLIMVRILAMETPRNAGDFVFHH